MIIINRVTVNKISINKVTSRAMMMAALLLVQIGCQAEQGSSANDQQAINDNQAISDSKQAINDPNQAINNPKQAASINTSRLGSWSAEQFDQDNKPLSVLSLVIRQLSTTHIAGSYCYVSNYGRKIDCDNDFVGNRQQDDKYLISFNSSFDNMKVTASLKFDNNSLVWQLLDYPKEMTVALPKDRVLTKNSEVVATEYTVINERAFIYENKSKSAKTAAYFIKGDTIKLLRVEDNWLYVSYKNNTKLGWLLVEDLTDNPRKVAVTKADLFPSDFKLTKDGVANIFINQPYDEQLFVEIADSRNPEVDYCFFAKAKNHPESLLDLYIIDNKVAAIYVGDSGFKSYTGIKVGDAEQKVYAKHANQSPEVYPNSYTGQPVIIYWNDDGSKIGTLYEIDQGRVQDIRVGYDEELKAAEGCS